PRRGKRGFSIGGTDGWGNPSTGLLLPPLCKLQSHFLMSHIRKAMGSGGADISRHTNKKPRRGALQGFYRNWCASAFCRVGSDALHSNPQYANGFPKVDQEA